MRTKVVQEDRRFQCKLKTKLHQSGVKQQEIARQAGLSPWRMSRIVNGVQVASYMEKKRLAQILGVNAEDLFISLCHCPPYPM